MMNKNNRTITLAVSHSPLRLRRTAHRPLCIVRNFQFAIKYLIIIIGLLFLGAFALPALAQDYRFGVPKLKMYVTVQPNASVKIDYEIQFRNHPGAHPIDIVDIGAPHADYSLKDIRA